MPPTTAVGLLVLVIAIVPGSLYTWAFERQAGSFGVAFTDRLLRFVAVSLLFHLLVGWPEYLLLRWCPPTPPWLESAPVFALVWVTALAYVGIPTVAGSVIGGLWASRIGREGWTRLRSRLPESAELRLLQFFVGRSPAPRAWDALFSVRPTAFVRLQLVDGTWVAGAFDESSYAAGFPNEPDLLLTPAWSLDDEQNLVAALPTSLYVPPGQIRLMEILLPDEPGGSHG